MTGSVAADIVQDFLMERRSLDREVYEAIRFQHLLALSVVEKEDKALC